MNWHTLTCQKTLEKLNTNFQIGLSETEAKKRKILYGKNALTQEKNRSFLRKLTSQFSDFMVITLIAAAGVSFTTSLLSRETDYIDTVIILGIVIINAFIGILQENKAEKEIQSLKRLSTPLAKIIRDGKIRRISSEDAVPGDILSLNTGDFICADSRIIESTNLEVEESALTGESFAREKFKDQISNINTPVADQKNMLFAGSVIERGHAIAVITATGANTEIGKVASLIKKEKQKETPLQLRLRSTGKIIAICIMAISITVFLLGAFQNIDLMEMFMISISLAVAAIPEGLPAVVTIVLANGVRRMAKRGAIVRNLTSVETLGHANIICSDKTGTLTLNKMTVTQISSSLKKESLTGHFAKEIFKLGALCNNSTLSRSRGDLSAQGEPTENALILAAAKSGINKKSLDSEYIKIFELPFDSERKLMTTLHETPQGYITTTKGAPEILLKLCTHYKSSENSVKPISETIIKKIQNTNQKMASEALRVLAIAYKKQHSKPTTENLESNLIFCGLIGIIDPPRPEAKTAVWECKKAGIKPVMITGDHIETALAIAKELGILSHPEEAILGNKLNLLTEEELEKCVNSYSVFARVSPEHKVRIVKALRAKGNIVAMTGDGVNDAPALKAADIGCAMGKSGTDAAKSAADIIITDDNFSTIVEAIKQGRGIFENIKKTIHFLISTNIGEVMVVLLGFLMKIPPPLLAIHLLWINLVTDAFPALALGMDPVDKNIMRKQAKNNEINIFKGAMAYNIIIEGCFIASVGLLSYSIGRIFFDINPLDPIIGRTMAFLTLGLSQLIHSFNVQSRKSLLATGFLSNLKLIWSVILCMILEVITVTIPCLTKFFKTQPLNFIQWLIVWLLAFSPLLISELEKQLERKNIYIYKNKF